MKFTLQLNKNTATTVMRRLGYTPERQDSKTGQLKFYRALRTSKYPRFHLYCTQSEDSLVGTLHLDQKQPSYRGTTAHSGEYDGPLVEAEIERISTLAKPRY